MRLQNGLGAAAALAIIFIANIAFADGGQPQRLGTFVATILALVLLLALIGREIQQRPAGIIIDNRNKISLSKLQATAWTVLIVGGLITAAAIRMHHGIPNPLDIGIDTHLLVVMGISATSLVATPAILSLKTAVPPKEEDVEHAKRVGAVEAEGQVHGRPNPEQASWADIFRGDELANAATADLSKIQQFLISMLLLTYYAILLGQMCWNGIGAKATLSPLPGFSEGIVWLLGISHAGYLGYKAAPHSGAPTAPTTRTTQSDPGDGAPATQVPKPESAKLSRSRRSPARTHAVETVEAGKEGVRNGRE